MQSLTRPEIVRIAACPTCCAYRGTSCTFARIDDPHGRRTYAGQSHAARAILARDIAGREKRSIQELAKSLKL